MASWPASLRSGTSALSLHRASVVAATAALALTTALVTTLPGGATTSGKTLAKDLSAHIVYGAATGATFAALAKAI